MYKKILEISSKGADNKRNKPLTQKEKEREIEKLTKQMKEAAKMLEFEHAAMLRDKITALKESK